MYEKQKKKFKIFLNEIVKLISAPWFTVSLIKLKEETDKKLKEIHKESEEDR